MVRLIYRLVILFLTIFFKQLGFTFQSFWKEYFRLSRRACFFLLCGTLFSSGMLIAITPTRALAKQKNNHQLEYRIKAIYLYNFIRFIEIPEKQEDRGSTLMRICILGQDPFKATTAIIEAQKPHGKTLRVVRLSSGSKVDGCHVVFVSNSEKKNLDTIIAQLKNSGILTVGDMPRFARRGGIIGFVIKRRKVRLEINLGAARREGLKISANLLEVATIVK